MPENKEEINILELLIKIKEDVATIKADMASFQKAQEQERKHIQEDYSELEDRVTELEKTITELKQADNNKDATKWRRVTAFILTALGGFSVSALFNLIKSFLENWKNGN
jgi:uncharacterized protein YlxW (UPF0749 family)